VSTESLGGGQVPPAAADRRLDADAFRLLVESTVDYAIFMLDPGGHVISWNKGAERIKGYAADDIIGRHFSVFYPADANARDWPSKELEFAKRDGRFEDEGWRVRKDGSRFWANVIITALWDGDGQLQGFAKVTRDMTQRKANEERIANLSRELQERVAELDRINQELAQRNAENESFVYSVSHDLRSPLVNLQGFSQELSIALGGLRTVLSEPSVTLETRTAAERIIGGELEESIHFIRSAVRHLSNIIDGLLRLSRVGRVEYERVPVDVRAVVAEILSAMHTTIAGSGARLQLGALPIVAGDRNAIGQVFANIIGNALKSLDPDRPGVLEIWATDADPPVFAVRDNGVGIAPDYQPKIFQVFQHVHSQRTRGEGMGLAIVRRIVERHGGRIWFESRPGEGTTFYFTLGSADPASAHHGGGGSDDRDA
jgi:PAS domain S-box-containing protein